MKKEESYRYSYVATTWPEVIIHSYQHLLPADVETVDEPHQTAWDWTNDVLPTFPPRADQWAKATEMKMWGGRVLRKHLQPPNCELPVDLQMQSTSLV